MAELLCGMAISQVSSSRSAGIRRSSSLVSLSSNRSDVTLFSEIVPGLSPKATTSTTVQVIQSHLSQAEDELKLQHLDQQEKDSTQLQDNSVTSSSAGSTQKSSSPGNKVESSNNTKEYNVPIQEETGDADEFSEVIRSNLSKIVDGFCCRLGYFANELFSKKLASRHLQRSVLNALYAGKVEEGANKLANGMYDIFRLNGNVYLLQTMITILRREDETKKVAVKMEEWIRSHHIKGISLSSPSQGSDFPPPLVAEGYQTSGIQEKSKTLHESKESIVINSEPPVKRPCHTDHVSLYYERSLQELEEQKKTREKSTQTDHTTIESQLQDITFLLQNALKKDDQLKYAYVHLKEKDDQLKDLQLKLREQAFQLKEKDFELKEKDIQLNTR